MNSHAELMRGALARCEGYCALGMWEEAWSALDDLPDDLRAYVEVFSLRLDVLIGTREWSKALTLAESLRSLQPNRADVWFRLACLQSRLGDFVAARASAKRCIELDSDWRLRVLDEPALATIF